MKIFFALLCFVFSFSAFAVEDTGSVIKAELPIVEDESLLNIGSSHSRFFNVTAEDKTQVGISINSLYNSDKTLRANNGNYLNRYVPLEANSYNFKISRGVSENISASMGIGYKTEKGNLTEGPSASNEVSSGGMKDIELNITTLSEITEDANLVYGLDGTFSPGKQILPEFGSPGNSFTGYHSVSPFIGYESLMGPSVMGMRFAPTFYFGGENSNSTYSNFVVDLKLFYEFPINQKFDFGVLGGLRNEHRAALADAFAVGFYSNYEYDNSTSVDLNLVMKNNEDSGKAESYSEVLIGVKKIL
jgi:hypothetical protein